MFWKIISIFKRIGFLSAAKFTLTECEHQKFCFFSSMHFDIFFNLLAQRVTWFVGNGLFFCVAPASGNLFKIIMFSWLVISVLCLLLSVVLASFYFIYFLCKFSIAVCLSKLAVWFWFLFVCRITTFAFYCFTLLVWFWFE